MDTRTKIREQAGPLPEGTRVVSGYFDPLLLEQAEWLREQRAKAQALAVVVLNPPEPVLSWRARAELVAALGCVDHVLAEGEAVEHFEEADLRARARFLEHVRERQS